MNVKEIKEGLLAKNILYLGGTVNGEMVEYVGTAIAELVARGAPPITVHMTSGGGEVTAALDAYDLLANYPSPVDGIVIAFAKSSAAVILQACTTRRAHAHARILIHHVSRREVSLDVMRNEKKRDEFLAEMEKSQARLYSILSERSGKSVRDIRHKCAKNEDMSTQEALKFGLIDGIVPNRPLVIVK